MNVACPCRCTRQSLSSPNTASAGLVDHLRLAGGDLVALVALGDDAELAQPHTADRLVIFHALPRSRMAAVRASTAASRKHTADLVRIYEGITVAIPCAGSRH